MVMTVPDNYEKTCFNAKKKISTNPPFAGRNTQQMAIPKNTGGPTTVGLA